jgi:hypothetical protein
MLSCKYAKYFKFDSDKFGLIKEMKEMSDAPTYLIVCACGLCKAVIDIKLPSTLENQDDFLNVFQYATELPERLLKTALVNYSYLGNTQDFRIGHACMKAINTGNYSKSEIVQFFTFIQNRPFANNLSVPLTLLLPITSHVNFKMVLACGHGKSLISKERFSNGTEQEIEMLLNIPFGILKIIVQENIVIAGGAAAWLSNRKNTILLQSSDIDVYVLKDCDPKSYKKMFCELNRVGYVLKMLNAGIVNCVHDNFRTIQIIFTLYGTVKEIVDDFDLSVSKFAISRDGDDEFLYNVMTFDAKYCMFTGICDLPTATSDLMHVRVSRIIKAEKKGWKLSKNAVEMVDNCEFPNESKRDENTMKIVTAENLPTFVPLSPRSAIFLKTAFYFPNRNNVFKNFTDSRNIAPFLKSCVRGEIIKNQTFRGFDGIIPLASPYSLKLLNVLPVFGCSLHYNNDDKIRSRKRVPCLVGNVESKKKFFDIEKSLLKMYGFTTPLGATTGYIVLSVDLHTIQIEPENIFQNFVTLTPFIIVVQSEQQRYGYVTWYVSSVCSITM